MHPTFINEVNRNPNLLWKKATSFQNIDYKNTLSNKLLDCSDLPDELNCNDVHCLNQSHLSLIDNYVYRIIDSIVEYAEEKLPFSIVNGNQCHDAIPFWNDLVKPYRDQAHFFAYLMTIQW